jgi:hypothetical protein
MKCKLKSGHCHSLWEVPLKMNNKHLGVRRTYRYPYTDVVLELWQDLIRDIEDVTITY